MLNLKQYFFPYFQVQNEQRTFSKKEMFLKRQNIMEGNGNEIKRAIKGFFYICFENVNVKKFLRIKKE